MAEEKIFWVSAKQTTSSIEDIIVPYNKNCPLCKESLSRAPACKEPLLRFIGCVATTPGPLSEKCTSNWNTWASCYQKNAANSS